MGSGGREVRVWVIEEDLPVWSGALVTAGDVVFYGTMDGWFKAVDAKDGHLLVAVQDRLGNRRPADLLSRSGRQAIHRRALRRRRMGRGGRLRRSRYTRWKRRRRNWQRDGRSEAAHDQGRHAVCLRASLRVRLACALALLACCSQVESRDLVVCADPDNLPFSQSGRQRIREPDRRARRARPWRAARLSLAAAATGRRPQDTRHGAVRRADGRSGRPGGRRHDDSVLSIELRARHARRTGARRFHRSMTCVSRASRIGVPLIGTDDAASRRHWRSPGAGSVDNVAGFPVYGAVNRSRNA